MNDLPNFIREHPEIIFVISLWALIWKGLALWQSAKRDEKYWFLAIFILNTMGILPIAYLLYKNDVFNKLAEIVRARK